MNEKHQEDPCFVLISTSPFLFHWPLVIPSCADTLGMFGLRLCMLYQIGARQLFGDVFAANGLPHSLA
jgi:hypothetical protein